MRRLLLLTLFASLAFAAPAAADGGGLNQPSDDGCPFVHTNESWTDDYPSTPGPVGMDAVEMRHAGVGLQGDELHIGFGVQEMTTQAVPGFRYVVWKVGFRVLGDPRSRAMELAYDTLNGRFVAAGHLAGVDIPVSVEDVTFGPWGGPEGSAKLSDLAIDPGDLLTDIEASAGGVTPYAADYYAHGSQGRGYWNAFFTYFDLPDVPAVDCPGVLVSSAVRIDRGQRVLFEGHALPATGGKLVVEALGSDGTWSAVDSFTADEGFPEFAGTATVPLGVSRVRLVLQSAAGAATSREVTLGAS